ncbi:MAG TPA: SprT family zinc-dependent metalloprotease [Anaerolineales bacterium]|nr:SprT family zinc-dependent metalloprotease [Anaerolineales bacterium]
MPIVINQIIRSKRKTLALVVRADSSLIVRAPLRASERSIEEFVQKYAGWIEKKQTEARAATPPAPRQFVGGENFTYLGDTYPLEIVRGQIPVLLLKENFKLAETAQNNAGAALERWYREQARQVLNERVSIYAKQHNFQYKQIRITSARSRWGSCSANGSLNFSWRLIMAPLEVVDYVVIHELVHTIVHNHSGRFWKKVAEILPDYKDRRQWLRRNGQQLTL